MADVSANLMDQFAQNLAEMLVEDATEKSGEAVIADAGAVDASIDDGEADADTEAASGEATAPQSGARKIDMPEPEAIDLIDAAGAPVLKRAATLAAVVVAFLLLRRLLRRSR